jgi:hypothetical protein
LESRSLIQKYARLVSEAVGAGGVEKMCRRLGFFEDLKERNDRLKDLVHRHHGFSKRSRDATGTSEVVDLIRAIARQDFSYGYGVMKGEGYPLNLAVEA